MFKRLLKMGFYILLIMFAVGLLLVAIPRLITAWAARGKIYSAAEAPIQRVAIVFGAGLWRNGNPTPVLVDRVTAAANLYFSGKVEKLLFSGDNRFIEYNEPEAMRQLALKLGVPSEAIVRDYAGRRTYDTCYRAKAIFGVEQAVLVTQAFHMPRALYLCNHLGVEAVGVPSDLRVYPRSSMLYWNVRELLATAEALWDVHIAHPLPVLGGQEPIFP